MWNVAEVHEQDGQRDDDISGCHEWNDERGEVSDTLDATDDDEGQDASQDDCGPGDVDAPGVLHCSGHTVGLDAWEEVAGSQNHGDSEDDAVDQHERAHRGVAVSLFDVVRRATAVLASVLVLFLVDLCESTFHERSSGPQQRHRPHPEDSTWATEGDRRGNTGNVADADATGEGNHQGLERRNTGV